MQDIQMSMYRALQKQMKQSSYCYSLIHGAYHPRAFRFVLNTLYGTRLSAITARNCRYTVHYSGCTQTRTLKFKGFGIM